MPLGSYNGLADQHLAHYFSNPTVRAHLMKMGLITESGCIVSESTYKIHTIRQQRKKELHEMLAAAIVQKTLDMERARKAEIERHLEDIAKIELVERVKSARSRRNNFFQSLEPDIISKRQIHPLSTTLTHTLSRTQLSSILKPVNRWTNSSFATDYSFHLYGAVNVSASCDNTESEEEVDRTPSYAENSHTEEMGDLEYSVPDRTLRPMSARPSRIRERISHSSALQCLNSDKFTVKPVCPPSPYLMSFPPSSSGISPRKCLRSANSSVGGHRPKCYQAVRSASASPLKKWGKYQDVQDSEVSRYQPLSPSEGSNKSLDNIFIVKEKKHTNNSGKKKVKSLCQIVMCYHGIIQPWQLTDWSHQRQEIVVQQQHCGGNPVIVFRGLLAAGEKFKFISRRHENYPFSVTIFIDGITDLRLSNCCEYRHLKGCRLGSRRGHFSLIDVKGGDPCLSCHFEKTMGIQRPRHPVASVIMSSHSQPQSASIARKSIPPVHKREVSSAPLAHMMSSPLSTGVQEKEIIILKNSKPNGFPQSFCTLPLSEENAQSPVTSVNSELEISGEKQHEKNANMESEEDSIIEEVTPEDVRDAKKEEIRSTGCTSEGEDDIPYAETCISYDYNESERESPNLAVNYNGCITIKDTSCTDKSKESVSYQYSSLNELQKSIDTACAVSDNKAISEDKVDVSVINKNNFHNLMGKDERGKLDCNEVGKEERLILENIKYEEESNILKDCTEKSESDVQTNDDTVANDDNVAEEYTLSPENNETEYVKENEHFLLQNGRGLVCNFSSDDEPVENGSQQIVQADVHIEPSVLEMSNNDTI